MALRDFSIGAFPGGGSDDRPPSPVVSGTVVQLTAYDKFNPVGLDVEIEWTVVGPFSSERNTYVAKGPTWDWDTQGLRAGAYVIHGRPLSKLSDDVDAGGGNLDDPFADNVPHNIPPEEQGKTITVILTPAVGTPNADGIVPVSLQRTSTIDTPQQALWVIIRNRTNAIGWRRYKDFIDGVMCSDPRQEGGGRAQWRPGGAPSAIPFRGTDAYQILKSATELFLMHESGVIDEDFELNDALGSSNGRLDADATFEDLERLDPAARERFVLDEQRRLGKRTSIERLRTLRNAYYDRLGQETVLPYLRIIREKLSDIPLKPSEEMPNNCYGILKSNLGGPVAMELIWSYWHEEGMLVQTLNAILARFQNRRTVAGRGPDPMMRFDLDPLRPLSNLFWGFAQDEIFRLTVKRRAFEYEHEYGLKLIGKAIPSEMVADRRSRFLEAFHNLLFLAHVFYKEDDDTTVIADAFPVLNALRETHLVLAEGAHNQFGDLPSTARAEMLIMEWLLARPEIREFLGGRIMVPYEEEWMDRVDMVKTMQGWTDSTITHFRDLGVFGEQLVLSIRYGNWSVENNPQEAANWARYWRPEIQRYAHAYRSATGVDLTERVDATMPSTLLQQRLVSLRRA